MPNHRTGECEVIPVRSERYFCTHGIWYFDIRGGKQKGPYIDKHEMESELLLYIQQQKTRD